MLPSWIDYVHIKIVKSMLSAVQLHTLTLFDMGGMMAPKMFLTTVPKRLGGGSWNFVTFNINLFSIKKSYFWFPRLSSVTKATSLSGGTRDFLKLSFHMFPYNEILKVFKCKIWDDIWRKHLKIPPNYQVSTKSVRGFGSYEHLKFRPMHWLKYRLWRHNDV